MERRKILLGSGAALATVLAGCSSSETGDDDPDNDDDESFSDDDGNGNDNDTDGNGNGDADADDDVPGVDDDALELTDKLTVTSVKHDGGKLDVVITTDTTDMDELRKEFEAVGDDLAAAITDREHFKAEIETIEWILEHEGSRVFSVYIDVEWVMDYLDDELSDEEFAEKVLETRE